MADNENFENNVADAADIAAAAAATEEFTNTIGFSLDRVVWYEC